MHIRNLQLATHICLYRSYAYGIIYQSCQVTCFPASYKICLTLTHSVCVCVCVCVCACVSQNIHTHTHANTHTSTHTTQHTPQQNATHTHTHTHTQTRFELQRAQPADLLLQAGSHCLQEGGVGQHVL